jgi:release factor glutamine methyltransferase
MTLREALTRATSQLDASPELRPSASRDATLLLLHTLGISRAALLADPGRALTPGQHTAYEALILRRLGNEPVQYITGEQEFYGLTLHATPAVLIPRPETEHLVEAVLAEFGCAPVAAPSTSSREASRTARSAIVDVGTGSGAIAIALAHHLPNTQVTALDLSPEAIEVAHSNAVLNSLDHRIRFLVSDLLSAVSGEPAFDVVVSNPPYIPTADRSTLHPQIRDFEPAAALFAGADGLDIYRRLIPQAHAALKPNGLLALEIGHRQREDVLDLLTDWNDVRVVNDLQDIPRVVLARKP